MNAAITKLTDLRDALRAAAAAIRRDAELPPIDLMIPMRPEFANRIKHSISLTRKRMKKRQRRAAKRGQKR
jgi:hypothetical protein